MEPVGFFSGVVSGFDWRTLVDQIIQIERRPIGRVETDISNTNTRLSAFQTFRSLLATFKTSVKDLRTGVAFEAVSTTTSGATAAGVPILSASAESGTSPGAYQVEVLALAQTEKLGGAQFADESTALNVSGDFFVNGARIQILTTDSLLSIRDKINDANAGNNPTKVTASILSSGAKVNRMLLTADDSGAAGIDLVDGTAGLLGTLGFLDGTTQIKHATSSGGESDRFSAKTTAIATLLGTGPVGSQNVTIGGLVVAIDLDNDSLSAIATKIGALTGVSATVQSKLLTDGTTEYYLDITGTTSFVDAGKALQLLGVVEGGRAAVKQSVAGDALTDNNNSTLATTVTNLVDLWTGGTDAGVLAGDKLTITGVRGDGTTVSLNYTIGAGDTVQTLLDFINNTTNGFGAGSRTATASIDAQGRIALTDGTAGDSQLSLSIVAHNDGGGTLDFGTFDIDKLGRDREIVTGSDAQVRVDGITLNRSSNTITDIVSGVTFTLHTADPAIKANVVVERSADTAVTKAQAFADAYNEILAFIQSNLTVKSGSTDIPILKGDSALRTTRSSLVDTLFTAVSGVASDMATASSVGISIQADGTLKIDTTKFKDAFNNRFTDLQRLFMERGTTTDAEVTFLTSSSTASSGTYAVNITTAATQASVQGSGFSGTYADDATADTMTVTEAGSGYAAQVQLSNSMTTTQIVDALNTDFQKALKHKLETANTLYSDSGTTTKIVAGTTFSSLYNSIGTPANVAAGDTISYTGVLPTGTVFASTFTVSDPTTDTIGDFVSHLQGNFGSDVTVSVANGKIVLEDNKTGDSLIALSLTENNQGGGSLDFGVMDIAVGGRGVMQLTASAVGNNIKITHTAYGATPGFVVAYTAGGSDGTAQLGITANTYNGVDVAGTIGGFAATGSGQQLVADAGTSIEGLHISYTGTTARAAGNVTLTVGTGALLERLMNQYLDAGTGLLDVKDDSFNDRIGRLESRIFGMEARLARRKLTLIKRFLNMEVLVGTLQSQSAAIGSQLSVLTTSISSAK